MQSNKKVSVIIPARNEEKFLQKTLEAYKLLPCSLEIIVVVNNSIDGTYKIAKEYADKVVDFPEKIGVAIARNKGAKIASGDIFIFSDADSYLSPVNIEKVILKIDENTIGTPLGKPDNNSIRANLFFFFKNWTHRLGIYHGVIDGVFFCHKNIFLKTDGFNSKIEPVELGDFIKKVKKVGAKYKVFTNSYAVSSMRRYEKKGYLNALLFWIKCGALSLFKKDKKLREKYFDEKL